MTVVGWKEHMLLTDQTRLLFSPVKRRSSILQAGQMLAVSRMTEKHWLQKTGPQQGWQNQSFSLHNLEARKSQCVLGGKNLSLLLYWHQASRTWNIWNQTVTVRITRYPCICQCHLGKGLSLYLPYQEITLELQRNSCAPSQLHTSSQISWVAQVPLCSISCPTKLKEWEHVDPHLWVFIHSNWRTTRTG